MLLAAGIRRLGRIGLEPSVIHKVGVPAVGGGSAPRIGALGADDRRPAGSLSAFDEIYATHAPLMRHIAMKKFDVPHEDAEALVHDVFASYLIRSDQIRELRPYLVGGICNASRQYWRRRRSEGAVFDDTPVLEDDFVEESAPPASETFALQQAIAVTLTRLRPRCRDTLRRFYLHGEPAAQIAAAMETTTAYVEQILHTCRKQAREIYRSITSRA
jgi:RNA polymerase sigma factor (sigma-70 family)